MIEVRANADNREVIIKIGHMDENTRRGIRRGFFLSGKKIMRDLSKDILRKPRSGRFYMFRTRNGRRINHFASVPGEAPANITGFLRKSREFLVQGWERLKIGYGAEYGKWLEFGTRKMKARPGLLINIKKNNRYIENTLKREIKKATQ